jgi:hypothetical protein
LGVLSVLVTSTFHLPDRLAHKADPALTGADEEHFAAIAASLEQSVAELTDRLAAARRAAAGHGQAALERDQDIHRLTARLRMLERFSLDLCLGRFVPADGGPPVYVGRLRLTGPDGRPLLVDWRSPAAEPFFAATHADPRGLASRRRYRWTGGRVTDYWDEVFSPEAAAGPVALDDDSAFLAGLAASRSPRMRDVLGTLQADQDAIIRADSRGTLVVDGGPGTGKTVVALHRAAYLLHADPRLGEGRGGVLVVGPHRPYLAYVADVLPSLGEEGVQTCTVRDLVPEGATAPEEADPEVARLKATVAMVGAIEPAVRFHEEVPTEGLLVETPWAELWMGPADWAEAFAVVDPGTPHNDAREQIWEAVLDVLVDGCPDGEVPPEQLRRALRRNEQLAEVMGRAWPLLDPVDVVADLWEVPAYLRRCAPWLTPGEVARLQRAEPRAWTRSDLPLLDAARQRVGDPEAARRRRRQQAAAAAERAEMDRVVDHLVAADDSDLQVMSMLRGADLRGALVDESLPAIEPDRLAGPFAHVVVDEAQELTDAEWLMLLRRCPSRSFTVVGDRAQARHGFAESWAERLRRVGLGAVRVAPLTVNYRTPAEVMAAAEPVIRAVVPDANVPTSIRTGETAVRHGSTAELEPLLADWLATHSEGTACVIGHPTFSGEGRVAALAPDEVKGLEFDLVVLVDPDAFGTGVQGAVDRYVAMTRATRQLVVLRSEESAEGSGAGSGTSRATYRRATRGRSPLHE